MLRTLIYQELLTHLMNARFFAAVVVILLLVVANTFVLIDAYEERLEDYSQKEAINWEKIANAPTYSFLAVKVERPPNRLSLFSAGVDTQFGSSIGLYNTLVPFHLSVGAPLGLKNPYLNLFSQIDLVFIFQVVLSLLALLFAYDAIAGDRESGTLRLLLSHPVGRGSILFAKYLTAMFCLLLPVVVSWLMALLLLSLTSSIQLNATDFLRVGGMFLTTVAYLSVFYLIGLLISTIPRTVTSLMLCIFLWAVLALVFPNWSRFSINPVGDTSAIRSSADQRINQIWEELDKEERRFLANSPLKGNPPAFNLKFPKWQRWTADRLDRINSELAAPSDPLVPHLQRYHEFMAGVQIRLAESAAFVEQEMAEQTDIRQAKWDERIMSLSPASLYAFTTAAWAGTDLDGMLDYIRAVQRYRRALINHFQEIDAFASLQWFATNQGTIDSTSLPRFRFEPEEVGVYAQRALPRLFLLFLTSIVLFITTFLIFVRTEV